MSAGPLPLPVSTMSHATVQSVNPKHPVSGIWSLTAEGSYVCTKPLLPAEAVCYPSDSPLTLIAKHILESTTPSTVGIVLGTPESLGGAERVYSLPMDAPEGTPWHQNPGSRSIVGLYVSSKVGHLMYFDDLVRQGEADFLESVSDFSRVPRWWFIDKSKTPLTAILLMESCTPELWPTGISSESLNLEVIPNGVALTPHNVVTQGYPIEATPIMSYVIEAEGILDLKAPTPLAPLDLINGMAPSDAALAYLDLGWPVLRVWPIKDNTCSCPGKCGNVGKHPMGGTSAYTLDREEARRWWQESPDAGVALATGVAFEVIDIDIKDDRDGFMSITDDTGLSLEPISSVGTTYQHTPSGGIHLLYAKDPMGVLSFKNFARKGSSGGIDMRSTGGIIICAPSYGANGVQYQWGAPASGMLSEIPPSLEKACLRWSAEVTLSARVDTDMPLWGTPEVEASIDSARVSEVLGTKFYQFLTDGIAIDRSAAIFSVCVRLFRARFTPVQVMWILCHSECFNVAADHRMGSPETWLWEYCVKKASLEAPPEPDDMFKPVKPPKDSKKDEDPAILVKIQAESKEPLAFLDTVGPAISETKEGALRVKKKKNIRVLIKHPKVPLALVKWEDRDLPIWCDKIEETLSVPLHPPLEEPPIFRRANGLCVVGMSSPTSVEDIARNTPVLSVGDLKQVGVIDLLTRYFRWEVPLNPNGGGGVRSIHCPRILATALLERAKTATSCKFPPLVAVTSCPTLRADGSVIDENGYDPETGLFLWSSIDFTDNPLPDTITEKDVIEAVHTLSEPFEDFPFANKTDWGVALAHTLTGIVRPILHSAPMFVYTAPTMGSGKTLAATVSSYIFSGSSPALASWSRNVEEQAKVLFALLLGGETSVLIDNLNGELTSEPLCTILTENSYAGRRLGVSEHVDVPTTCTWAVSGNNIVVRGDLTTRALVCRIDAKLERPEERKFDRNLHEWVPANRTQLVRAALIILKGYFDAGSPAKNQLPMWGRFEHWSEKVRAPLYWATQLAGIKDAEGSLGVDVYQGTSRLHVDDPEREERLCLLSSLRQVFGYKEFSAAKLLRVFRNPVDPLFLDATVGSSANHEKIESRSDIEDMPHEFDSQKEARDNLLAQWDKAVALDWLRDWAGNVDPRRSNSGGVTSKGVSSALTRSCDIPVIGIVLINKGLGGVSAVKHFEIQEV